MVEEQGDCQEIGGEVVFVFVFVSSKHMFKSPLGLTKWCGVKKTSGPN